MEFRDVVRLTICTGEDVFVDDELLYKLLPRKIAELGLAGVTVSKGEFGYANKHRGSGSSMTKFFTGKIDRPIYIEIVDTRENIDKLLPFLEKNAKHSIVTISECQLLVSDYLREVWSKNNK